MVCRPCLSPVQSIFHSLYFILVQLTLLCLVVYGSTVSAPRALLSFSFLVFLYSFISFSLHYVNGINKVMLMMMMTLFPLSALTLLVRRQEKHLACKQPVVVCWEWHFDWSFPCLLALAVTTTSSMLSSNKIQNSDILVQAYRGFPGKWPLNWCHVLCVTASMEQKCSTLYTWEPSLSRVHDIQQASVTITQAVLPTCQ